MKLPIVKLRALLAKATPGPVHVDAMDCGGLSGEKNYHVVAGGQTVAMVPEGLFQDVNPWQAKREAELLVALRNHAPDLLEAIERERAGLPHDTVRGALDGLVVLARNLAEDWEKYGDKGAAIALRSFARNIVAKREELLTQGKGCAHV